MQNRIVCLEERLVAACLVDEALEGWEEDVHPAVVQRLREKLIEDLLWTARGRERLGKVLGRLPG